MKQVLQHLDTGKTELAEVPAPGCGEGSLLIRTHASLVSLGTERMLVEFGRASLLGKVRQQPERVKDVLAKIRTDGIVPTLEAVRSKLATPLGLGYSSAGVVLEVGSSVSGFEVGDPVVSNGPHAEIVCVPQNLCAPIPDSGRRISFDEAAFAVPAAIGLQGLRLAEPTLGERFAVFGLGLIGQLVVQLLKADGCQVLGIDPDAEKSALATRFGAEVVDLSRGEDPVDAALHWTRGRGVDGVIIAASTPSSEPVHQAAEMARKRGRIVLVGVTGLELRRSDFYEKELSFQVSCSYGPGRYDPDYEDRGRDYPVGYVRWTVARNFETVLDLLAAGRLKVTPLITHRFEIDQAVHAYETVLSEGRALGVLLSYPGAPNSPGEAARSRRMHPRSVLARPSKEGPYVALIGTGNFGARILGPALRDAGAALHTVVSRGGVSAKTVADRLGFERVGTDAGAAIGEPKVNAVFLATRHDSHAALVVESLVAGKHVFVEKPLAIERSQLADVENTYQTLLSEGATPLLGIGFNRRFAPHTVKMKQLLAGVRGPKALVMTVNAGFIPSDHWVHDPVLGGGRILGEACHFVDLLRFLVGAPIDRVHGVALRGSERRASEDNATLTIAFGDGSIGTVHYFSNGDRRYPKETLDVFAGGRILRLSNFRTLVGYGWPRFRRMRSWKQDKGHQGCVRAFLAAVETGAPAPIPPEEIFEVTRAMLDFQDSLGRN